MTSLFRSRIHFTGFIGAPGVATLYSLDISTWVAALDTLADAMVVDMPSGASATVDHFGDEIEDTTGALVGSWDDHSLSHVVSGEGGAAYSPASGSLIQWRTGSILDGHRLQGHTFVVPLSADAYTSAGVVNSAHTGPLLDAASAFIADQSSSFVLWHRPFPGRAAGPGTPPKPKAKAAHDGGHALVVSAGVPDKACVLRSRRDN